MPLFDSDIDLGTTGKVTGAADATSNSEYMTKGQVDTLITNLKAQTAFINVHGATAGTARNADFAINLWIGTVDPTNATSNDIVVRTDLAVTP